MKKIVLTLASLLCAFPMLMAQNTDSILKLIEGKQGGGIPLDRRFEENRTGFPGKADVTLVGKLRYRAPDTFIMNYDNGEDFVIDGKLMTINRDGKLMQCDLAKNKMMSSLSRILLCSFSGTLATLAREQNSEIKASKTKEGYIVTLINTKKMPRGYSKVEVLYSLKDCSVVNVLMQEFTGQQTFYSWEK